MTPKTQPTPCAEAVEASLKIRLQCEIHTGEPYPIRDITVAQIIDTAMRQRDKRARELLEQALAFMQGQTSPLFSRGIIQGYIETITAIETFLKEKP